MLKYSDKLDKYVKSIVPLLTLSNKYKVIGSYGRTKYITDIDITNYVNENMYFHDRLNEISKKLPKNVKLFTLTSGVDKSYQVPWNIINENKIMDYDYIRSINFINELLFNHKITEKERDYCNELLSEKPVINNIILIEDLLYPKSKIKWNNDEIIKGVKEINNQKINLNTSVRTNENNIVHYIIEYDDDIIPVDVALIKENQKQEKHEQFDKKVYLMFVKKEYYFILAYLKKYFKGKKEYNKIKYLLDDKWGHYKQILMNIFYLIQFLEYPIYDNNEFKKILGKVISKVDLNDIDQKIIKDIKNNIHNKEKLKDLFRQLESKTLLRLNVIFKDYAYQYYLKIPNKTQIKFADLAFDIKN